MCQRWGYPKTTSSLTCGESLGRAETAEPLVPYHRLTEDLAVLEERAALTRQRLEENRAALVDRFAETAKLRNWNLFRTTSAEAAVGYIVELCPVPGRRTRWPARTNPRSPNCPWTPPLRGGGMSSITIARGRRQFPTATQEPDCCVRRRADRGRLRRCRNRLGGCPAASGDSAGWCPWCRRCTWPSFAPRT